MGKAVAIFTGGIQADVQVAVRADGETFRRSQSRHPMYGYRWSAWTRTARVEPDAPTTEAGFSTLRRATPNDCYINNRALFNARGEIRVRLP